MILPAGEIHCHYCVRWLGETSRPLVFVGMFQSPHDRTRVDGPRDTYRCKSCGWVNVFQSQANAAVRDYRAGIELKTDTPTPNPRAA